MRTILLGLSALTAVVALTTARADAQGYQVYPWCAEYSRLIGGAILVNGTGVARIATSRKESVLRLCRLSGGPASIGTQTPLSLDGAQTLL